MAIRQSVRRDEALGYLRMLGNRARGLVRRESRRLRLPAPDVMGINQEEMKVARTKPKTMIIGDLKGAEAALAEIAQIDRGVAAYEATMNETIDQAKANGKALCDPLLARRKALADAVATYATMNKAELFDKRRSRDLGFGVIGFRKVTKLLAKPKVAMGAVLERLHELGFTTAIRVKETVDKEAMREWPDERLDTVGMRRVSDDEFYIEINQEAVENAA